VSFTNVQVGGTTNTNNASTITITKTVTAGNVVKLDLVAFVQAGAIRNAQWVITDNSGAHNIWILGGHGEYFYASNNTYVIESWFAVMLSSGSITFTATAASSSSVQTLGMSEFSYTGGNWVMPVYGSQLFNGPTPASTTTPSAGTPPFTQAGDLIYGATITNATTGTTTLAGSGFTQVYTQAVAAAKTAAGFEFLIAADSTPVNVAFTLSNSANNSLLFSGALRVVTLPAIPASFTCQYESDVNVYSSGTTPATIGGTVGVLTDITGNYSLTAGTAPTWTTNSLAANGLPGLTFAAASSQYLTDSFDTTERKTVVAVYMPTLTSQASAAGYGILGADASDNGTVPAYAMMVSTNNALGTCPGSPATWGRATEADTSLPLALQGAMWPSWNVVCVHGARTDTTSGSLQTRMYQGGILMQTATSVSSVRPTLTATSVVGCTRASLANANYFNGTFYALYQAPTDVSDADFTQLQQRIALKYGVPQAMPATTYVGAFFENAASGLNAGTSKEGGGNDRLYMTFSQDGYNFNFVPSAYNVTTSGNTIRDCRLIRYNGQWLFGYSGVGSVGGFGLATSGDLINWAFVANPNLQTIIGGGTIKWNASPNIAIDPTTGVLHCFIMGNPNAASGPSGCNIYEAHLTNPADLTSWSNSSLVYTDPGGSSNACLDPFYIYNASYSSGAGPHQLWYSYYTASGTAFNIQVASCATVNGTYTDTKTGTWMGLQMNGANAKVDGPFLFPIAGGLWQIWVDGDTTTSIPGYGYWTTTSTTTDPLGTWNTGLLPISGPFASNGRLQHGQMTQYIAPGGTSGGSAMMLNAFRMQNFFPRRRQRQAILEHIDI